MKKLVFAFLITTFLFSCKQNTKKKSQKSISQTTSMEAVVGIKQKNTTINNASRGSNMYSYNFELKNNLNESYFNTKNLNELILKVPVSNSAFKIENVYYFAQKGKQKALLVHVTDNTETSSCNGNITNRIEAIVPINSVISYKTPQKLALTKLDKLYVFVINDKPASFQNNKEAYVKKLISILNNPESWKWGCQNFKKNYDTFSKKTNNDYVITNNFKPQEIGGGILIGKP